MSHATLWIFLVLLILPSNTFSLTSPSACTNLQGDEKTSLSAASLNCTSKGVYCDVGSDGVCHVIHLETGLWYGRGGDPPSPVTISFPALKSIELGPELFNVPAFSLLDNCQTISVSLPSLVSIWSPDAPYGLQVWGCNTLKSFQAPALQSVNVSIGSALDFTGCPSLKCLSLPSLEWISAGGIQGFGVEVTNMSSLESFSAPNLKTIAMMEGDESCLYFGQLPSFKSIDFPSLSVAQCNSEGFQFFNCPKLQLIAFPLLQEITYSGGDVGIYIINNDALVEINFPQLKTLGWNLRACFFANQNANLRTVNLPLLEECASGDLVIQYQQESCTNLASLTSVSSDATNEISSTLPSVANMRPLANLKLVNVSLAPGTTCVK